jgi:DtxR family transcriptional regulator, Mn-dependent transcriptional regulator
MNVRLSASVEDYLKTIYGLTRDQARASTNEIAEGMRVSAASTTGMVQRLVAVDPPLVDYQKYRGVSLTLEGEQAALEIIRHHRLLEAFLHEKLGYGWDEVHAEADRLEHVISEELEERISLALGDPAYDPHGDPIPTRELDMPDVSNMRLNEARPGDQVIVQRINDDDPELLRYLSSIRLRLNSSITVLRVSPFDGNVHLQVDGQDDPVVLGELVTSQILVKPR